MQYPGRIIKVGEADSSIVKALKSQLNEALGAKDDPTLFLEPNEPHFGPKMQQVVTFFQARHVDATGHPLRADGEIGSLTWSALFGSGTAPLQNATAEPFLARVLQIAEAEEAKKVREVPKNSNRGPQVEAYLHRAGVDPGLSWCCAFVYWCFDEAAHGLGRENPMVKTAGCLDHWHRASAKGAECIPAPQAVNNPAEVRPGMIFIMDHGGGLGHTGLVEKVDGGLLTTIEGNTDATGGREGGGVYRLTRKIVAINAGFIDYSGL
jgi:hypothetical protein